MEYEDCAILRSIQLPKDRIHPVALVCGNIYRLKTFSQYGTNYREFGEFLSYKAAEIEFDSEMLLLVCHGVSASSSFQILRELIEMGVKVILRNGTCGTYKPSISRAGDLYLCYASIRDDSNSLSEIDVRYPSVADFEIIDELADTSELLGYPVNYSISYTSDLFYRKTCKEDHRNCFALNNVADTEENELGSIFLVGSLYGAKVGAVLTVDGIPLEWSRGNYRQGDKSVNDGVHRMIQLVLKTGARLSKKYHK